MNIIPRKEVPEDILKDSVLAHIAAAYFSVGKRLERKTRCSATRGFICDPCEAPLRSIRIRSPRF